MKIISANLLVLSLAAISCVALADDLPRHGVIGVLVSPSDPAKPEDPKTNPPTAQTVLPGSSADVAGIQPGDVLVSLDSQPVTSSTDFARAVGRHLAGERLQIQILRKGQPLTVSVTLKPRPFESSPDADVLYTSVSVNGSRRRAIVTHPKSSGRYPAVLLMPGLGCYTLDGALSQDQGYGPILAFLAKSNFVTVRVEKTGQGDSDGPACTDRAPQPIAKPRVTLPPSSFSNPPTLSTPTISSFSRTASARSSERSFCRNCKSVVSSLPKPSDAVGSNMKSKMSVAKQPCKESLTTRSTK